jgi:membrane-bound serine protease (ClpP class)
MLPWVYAFSLLILGFALILLDIFITPGVDILGLFGVLAVGAGIALAYAELGLGPALIIGAIGLTGTAILVRLLVRARAWRHLVLESSTSRASGYDSAEPGREALLGQRGEALTALRPSGRARFGEQVVDVTSEGGFIDRGAPVEVLRVAGNRVTVHRTPE